MDPGRAGFVFVLADRSRAAFGTERRSVSPDGGRDAPERGSAADDGVLPAGRGGAAVFLARNLVFLRKVFCDPSISLEEPV